jgi:hypothetical protein
MVGYSGCSVTGEIRVKSASGEQVYKVLAVGRMDVKHDLITFEGWDGQRQYVDAGRSRITLSDVILDTPVVLSEKEWQDVGAIVQAAGTAIPQHSDLGRRWRATEQYDKHGAYYTAESFASEIANAFYAGEEQRAEAAGIADALSDYSW